MESFSDILGMQSTPNLGRYLGIPIKSQGPSSQDFNFILERVKQKLSGWKADSLLLEDQCWFKLLRPPYQIM